MEQSKKTRGSIWVLVLVISILTSLVIGQAKKPDIQNVHDGLDHDEKVNLTQVYPEEYRSFIMDAADILSDNEEQVIMQYNATWDMRYNSIIAIVTDHTAGEDSLEDISFDLANDLGLGEGDAILVIAVDDGEYFFNYNASEVMKTVYVFLDEDILSKNEAFLGGTWDDLAELKR